MIVVLDVKMVFCICLRYSFVKIYINYLNGLLLEIMKILWDFVKKFYLKFLGNIFFKREKFFFIGIKFR